MRFEELEIIVVILMLEYIKPRFRKGERVSRYPALGERQGTAPFVFIIALFR